MHPESIQIHQRYPPTSIFGKGHEKGRPWVQQWSPPVLQEGHFWRPFSFKNPKDVPNGAQREPKVGKKGIQKLIQKSMPKKIENGAKWLST